jgi:hypothetical protein
MASGYDMVRQHIYANYKVSADDDGLLGLAFSLPDGRTQMVFVGRHTLMDGREEWVEVVSPICEMGAANCHALLQDAGNMVVGGLTVFGERISLKHVMRATRIDLEELDRVIRLIVSSADQLERTHVGGDEY